MPSLEQSPVKSHEFGIPNSPEILPLAIDMEARLNPIEHIDQAGFIRTEFEVPGSDGVTIMFRDREELPYLEDDPSVTTGILSPDEKPLHTSGDDFGKWEAELTDYELMADPFERAAEGNTDKVRLIATSTPRGIVTAAVKLAELGVSKVDDKKLSQLKSLQKKLEDQIADDEILDLYDDLFAASAITTNEGTVVANEYNWVNPNEQGLMEVLMAISGDEQARELVNAKRQVVDGFTLAAEEKYKTYAGYDEAVDMKQPGEMLSAEELDILASKHLVGVHTTPIKPYFIDESGHGVSIIRPTSGFGEEQDRYPRSTLHWSLNHPVQSHISGGFGGRPFTLVAPMEDLARLNGAPAVLYGVDTYFTTNPNEGIMIPENAKMIAFESDPNAPGMVIDGNTIQIKDGNLTTENMEQMLEVLSRDILELPGSPEDARNSALFNLAYRFMDYSSGEFRKYIHSMVSEKHHGRNSEYDTDERTAYLKTQDQLKELLDDSLGEGRDFLDLDDTQMQREFITITRRLFTEPGLIEKYPEIQKILVEDIRKTVITCEIARLGGKVVTSDGQSAYIEDRDFSIAVNDAAKAIGLRSGLHVNNPEKQLEYAYDQAMNKAIKTVAIPDGAPQDSPSESRALADFDWAEFEVFGLSLWGAVAQAPKPTRRLAISMGILPHARRKPVKSDPWELGD